MTPINCTLEKFLLTIDLENQKNQLLIETTTVEVRPLNGHIFIRTLTNLVFTTWNFISRYFCRKLEEFNYCYKSIVLVSSDNLNLTSYSYINIVYIRFSLVTYRTIKITTVKSNIKVKFILKTCIWLVVPNS